MPREHYGVAHKLKKHLSSGAGRPEFVHVGLMGHAGVGKTTLARSALAELARDGLTPVYIRSLEAFDQGDFVFSDLMLVVAEAIIRELGGLQLEVAGEHLEAVRGWFADEILIATHSEQILGSLEVSADAGVSVPFLAAFAAKVTAALKSDNEYRREIRRRTERDPAALVRRLNLLLDAVHKALAPRRSKLCVVFDDLEKMNPALVDGALLARAPEFRQLRTNALLFFNPSCEYSPYTTPASRAFTCINMPVLPVRFPGDAPDIVRPEAANAIAQLLQHRMALDAVFTDPSACIHALAHWSGGHIGDIMMIARRAVENVEPDKVEVTDIENAGRWLGGRRTSTLRPSDFARAVEIHKSHRILDTDQDRRMLKNSCILPYDGIEWWDVHPGVRADELFLEALREARSPG
ncbi:AAA family ATPase [Enhygromyxa salina]|uniref:AAA family ATPase n=1 Tax=Enhygromyxa salina TaxID=215803 RepID=UPI0013FD0E15|nr:AAA family ATPase [Enhygromyxa salina]